MNCNIASETITYAYIIFHYNVFQFSYKIPYFLSFLSNSLNNLAWAKFWAISPESGTPTCTSRRRSLQPTLGLAHSGLVHQAAGSPLLREEYTPLGSRTSTTIKYFIKCCFWKQLYNRYHSHSRKYQRGRRELLGGQVYLKSRHKEDKIRRKAMRHKL